MKRVVDAIVRRPALAGAALMAVLVLLALVRPIDHDESQYVAAAVLAGHGLPYRDFAYLQVPLQPMLMAPLAALAGSDVHLVLRLANALFGWMVVAAVWRTAREAGTGPAPAILAAAALACCDILLFSAAVARNDALPAAALSGAMLLAMRAGRARPGAGAAWLAGLLLAGAAAAKISYALPAAVYGVHVLIHRQHRPVWVAAGAALPVVLVAALWWTAPDGFRFGVFDFPARAPEQYYLDDGRGWKLSPAVKLLDAVKFLALGPALLALILVAARRRGGPSASLLDAWIVAGLVAALLPSPVWRQYLLPVLPPLFVRAAMLVAGHPPRRALRIVGMVFAGAGLAPSIAAVADSVAHGSQLLQGRRDGAAFAALRIAGPVASLSPHLVAAGGARIDPRFATGPFHFRSRNLIDPASEERLHLVSRERLDRAFRRRPPAAILTGGEAGASAGDDALDRVLDRWAAAAGWRRTDLDGGRLVVWRPQAAARARASISD